MDVDTKLCGCGTCREHMVKAGKLLADISEKNKMCSGSKMTVTRFMFTMACAEHSLAIAQSEGARTDDDIARIRADVHFVSMMLDTAAADPGFVPYVESYINTVQMINEERYGRATDDGKAAEMLKDALSKKGGADGEA